MGTFHVAFFCLSDKVAPISCDQGQRTGQNGEYVCPLFISGEEEKAMRIIIAAVVPTHHANGARTTL